MTSWYLPRLKLSRMRFAVPQRKEVISEWFMDVGYSPWRSRLGATTLAFYAVGGWFATLALLGLTQGMVQATWGALWPALYGTRHLGAVRAMATTVMVFSTAIGPGITGLLIDAGIALPAQAPAMALWCSGVSAFLLLVLRGLGADALRR